MIVDREKLRLLLEQECGGENLCSELLRQRPHLFASGAVFLERDLARQMQETIAAVETVVALPAYREAVLARSPSIVHFDPGARGVFIGYDFHLAGARPQLIEINTNAGGGLLNAKLARVMLGGNDGDHCERAFVEMFREEWRIRHGDRPPRNILIVDDQPAGQYLYPEFLLFRALFRRHGLNAEIADPGELAYREGVLWHRDMPCDLVYNRLTDFLLDEPRHENLRRAYLDGAVMMTPHPRAHALYADKRNLVLLGDAGRLRAFGAAEDVIQALRCSIPATVEVTPDNAGQLWQQRRRLFFKPAGGYGSRGAYRGEKLTRRVWEEIRNGEYVAQDFVPPSECELGDEGARSSLKVDFRLYTYAGAAQLIAARLYQGQTTNFRTPLGGFAPVRLT
ncbi:MAG: hypothetical protein C3F18_01875 [Nitrosomonadales bacterium]|nr:MAG: hypothetical protein C3F18_01875 [Nitrosomonadales bacterium]